LARRVIERLDGYLTNVLYSFSTKKYCKFYLRTLTRHQTTKKKTRRIYVYRRKKTKVFDLFDNVSIIFLSMFYSFLRISLFSKVVLEHFVVFCIQKHSQCNNTWECSYMTFTIIKKTKLCCFSLFLFFLHH